MATELDHVLDSIMDAMVQPGQAFETVRFEQFGQQVPAFKNAPPSLAHYFAHYCDEHADLTFLVDGETRLTFAETYAAARNVAAGLVSKHGVKKGDRVGIAAHNSANWIIAYMGAAMAGGCVTLLNGFWTGEELAYGTRLAECSLLLADQPRAQRMEGTDHPARVVIIGHNGPASEGLENVWADADASDGLLPQLTPDDPATILFTSGSTGFPKGAWSDHRGVVSGTLSYVAQTAMAALVLTTQGNPPVGQPSALGAVPLFHVTGEVPLFLQSYAIGRKLVMMPKWDAQEAMRLIEAESISYFVGVPLMSYEMASHPDRANYDLSSCKSFAAGGAPRPVDHVVKIKEAFPESFPLLGYGLTETNAVGCGNFNENYLAKPGSTGKASRPIVALAILNDDGEALPQGEIAEVCIRSVANFRGYWKNDEATEAAFTPDGYFRTGDLGYLDEDGYLFIVDRKKDIIIRGGENISCIEVEQALYAHPDVVECSVFGLPDERYGEVVGAIYLAREGKSLSSEKLLAFLDGKLAPYKMPAHVWQASEPLPKLGTQKIDKKSLREHYSAQMRSRAETG